MRPVFFAAAELQAVLLRELAMLHHHQGMALQARYRNWHRVRKSRVQAALHTIGAMFCGPFVAVAHEAVPR